MKRLYLFNILTALMFVLTACSGGISEGEDENGNTQGQTQARSRLIVDQDQIPVNQLVMGTMQLEESELAVTNEQAKSLLTLWKAYRSLIESDTAAQAEVQAVLSQIKQTMTTEQLEAIRTMEFSPDEFAASFDEQQDMASGDQTEGGAREGFFQGGGPEGGPAMAPGAGLERGGGPGPGFEGEMNPEQMATLQAMRAERGGGMNRMGSFLINPLIELLESKAAG